MAVSGCGQLMRKTWEKQGTAWPWTYSVSAGQQRNHTGRQNCGSGQTEVKTVAYRDRTGCPQHISSTERPWDSTLTQMSGLWVSKSICLVTAGNKNMRLAQPLASRDPLVPPNSGLRIHTTTKGKSSTLTP